jgi:hypothetical protein
MSFAPKALAVAISWTHHNNICSGSNVVWKREINAIAMA